jgi:hypothetical protein
LRPALFVGAAVWAAGSAASAQAIPGTPILDIRARAETVDQQGLARDAQAWTLRTAFGWETPAFHGFKALAEIEDVRAAGRFNVAVPGPGGASLNGKTAYPSVNDPQVTELNRLQVAWTPNAAVSATLGRQRIQLDDQRFVGNAGWRQDDQTFDAARLDVAHAAFRATYVYIDRVNRTFGQTRDWRSDSHLLNASWLPSSNLRLTGFVYALDFSNSPLNSSLTAGARLSGKGAAGPFKLTYNGAVARQRDWRNNPADFALHQYEGDLAATRGAWTLKGSYEQLGGDGRIGFSTPLGTNHALQGWADAFAVAGGSKTHVDGIKDAALSLAWQPHFKAAHWSNTQVTVAYHDFNAQRTGADLAHEWDAQVQASLSRQLTLLVKYADFERQPAAPTATTAAPPSRRKGWVSLQYRL